MHRTMRDDGVNPEREGGPPYAGDLWQADHVVPVSEVGRRCRLNSSVDPVVESSPGVKP